VSIIPFPEAERRFGEACAWRGLTRSVDGAACSLSFLRPDGTILRLSLTGDDARLIADALAEAWPKSNSGSSSVYDGCFDPVAPPRSSAFPSISRSRLSSAMSRSTEIAEDRATTPSPSAVKPPVSSRIDAISCVTVGANRSWNAPMAICSNPAAISTKTISANPPSVLPRHLGTFEGERKRLAPRATEEDYGAARALCALAALTVFIAAVAWWMGAL
jgi:hypothetical protein